MPVPRGVRRQPKGSTMCPRCKVRKKEIGSNHKLAPYCRQCRQEYSQKHYEENKDKYKQNYENDKEKKKAQSRASVKRRTYRLKAILWKWKQQPCVDCGLKQPLVIDPDHVLGTKMQNVSQMVRNTCTEAELICELTKCEPRCANCHRLKTAKEQGHYKDFM